MINRNKGLGGIVIFMLFFIGVIRYNVKSNTIENQLPALKKIRNTANNYRILTNKTIEKACKPYNLEMNLSHYETQKMGPTESELSSASSSMTMAKMI